MSEHALRNLNILIVEDEYMLAQDLRHDLAKAGAYVVGMASTVKDALGLVAEHGRLDGAVLDVNLGGEPVFPLADHLLEQGVPFVFTTGYDASAIPARFQGVLRCEKPFGPGAVVRSL